MEVFYLSILCEFICDILFCSFLVDIGDHYDPAFDGWERRGFLGSCAVEVGKEECTSCRSRLGCRFNPVKLLIPSNSALVPTCGADEKNENERSEPYVGTYQNSETHDPCGVRHLRCLRMIISQQPHLSVHTDLRRCSFHPPTFRFRSVSTRVCL